MGLRGIAILITMVFAFGDAAIAMFGSDKLLVQVSTIGGLAVGVLWLLVLLSERRTPASTDEQ